VSLLTGARTEELRALTWSHTDLDGDPPSVQLWRSVREGGDTKTRLSRRTLELPNECVVALRAHRRWQTRSRAQRGTMARQRSRLHDATRHPSGRGQRPACLPPGGRARWAPSGGMDTPRAAAQFVSLLSSGGIPIEDIAHLVGHANTRTTEKVYRKELRPVLRRGAKAMDDLFKAHHAAGEPPTLPPRRVRTKQSAENDTDAIGA
jgi:integrase